MRIHLDEIIREFSTFRPLAGFWFLNFWENVKNAVVSNNFPSPCGVLVLKFKRGEWEEKQEGNFPSPCGVLVLK